MMFNVICWNCRGAASKHFHIICNDLCREYKVDIMVILEPRCSGDRADKVIDRMRFDSSWRMEARGYSGGIWILWNSGKFKVYAVDEMDQCITVKVSTGDEDFMLSCVYGSTSMKTREKLWEHLLSLSLASQNLPWAILGDFNAYLFEEEKQGGGRPNRRSISQFADCVETCGLLDLGFNGPKFTWSNGRVHERLDRCLIKGVWDSHIPDAKIWHLNQLKSDHRPVLLKINSSTSMHQSSYSPLFRFQAAWLTDDSFSEVVKKAWDDDKDWFEATNRFVGSARVWNKNYFGNIFRKKERILRRLKGIGVAIARGSPKNFDHIQKTLWKEYEDILIQEEVYWAQKARCNWLTLGDRNTKFFHDSVKTKRKRMYVEMLKSDDGAWINSQDDLRAMAVDYFRNLYANTDVVASGRLHNKY